MGGDSDSVTRVLLAMPSLTRRTNMSVLADRLQPMTLVVVLCHGLLTTAHFAHLVLRSQGDRVFNDATTFIAAETTWSYLFAAVLQRHTLRRLHAELIEYCRYVEEHTALRQREVLLPLPRRLRRMWVAQTAFLMSTWGFYTASPFVFEYIHDIPLGSLRRLSGMVFPEPCDLSGSVCYYITYFLVASEWFWAALAFSSVECTNMVYFTVAAKQFEVLGASLSQVMSEGSSDGAEQGRLRRCIMQHQFLLRWSHDMTRVYATPLFGRLGSMVVLITMPLLKMLLVENYVLDELPLVGLYGVQTVFVLCWFADELNHSSAEVHVKAYMSSWYRGHPDFRRSFQVLLTRTLRPVQTQAGWVGNLSLRTFLEVLNRSYSAMQTIRATRRKAGAEEH